MKRGWFVSYVRLTPESIEHGVAADRGFLLQDVPFREAWDTFMYESGGAEEPDSWPISLRCPPRWFTSYPSHDFRTGAETTWSLHMPEHITPSSRLRLARLLKLKMEG